MADEFSIKGAAHRRVSQTSEVRSLSQGSTTQATSTIPQQRSLSPDSEPYKKLQRPPSLPVDPSTYGKVPRESSSPRNGSEDGQVDEERAISADPYSDNPPLPAEDPPLPDEPPPDDGWEPRFDSSTQRWYFFNRFTGLSQWENPRVPEAAHIPDSALAPGVASSSRGYSGAPGTDLAQVTPSSPPRDVYRGYNPKIHGNYDPNADYAKFHEPPKDEEATAETAGAAGVVDPYAVQGTFNRWTGAFQGGDRTAEYHNDENKSKRQMNAYFDVDRAANSHDGRSLKAERSTKKLSKKEVKQFNEQRRAKKEQKRRDFLMS